MYVMRLARSFFTYLLVGIGLFVCGVAFFVSQHKFVDFSALEQYNPGKPTIVLDEQGIEWARFELDRRQPVTLEQMPKWLINAFIAAEDHDFFTHTGISYRGIIRSFIANIRRGKFVQGASTITQQLVKLLFFDAQKTFKRKVSEQIYAVLIEQQFTKEQILETYLNHLYFGSGVYGVQAASQRFFGVDVQCLTLAQSATLAAIIKSPGKYSPLVSCAHAQHRRDIILKSMAQLGSIDRLQLRGALAEPLVIHTISHDMLAPHAKEGIRMYLEPLVGRTRLYTGGLVVQTTLDSGLQRHAQSIFKEHIVRMRKNVVPAIDGGLLSIETQTGKIKAIIGGYDFNHSQFNRALQARRQMGSIFKPIIYAAAVESGMTFDHVMVDEEMELSSPQGVWAPTNYNEQFDGPITLARALSFSNNIVAIKTLLQVGCERVVALGSRFGINDLLPYPSLALGCVDITLKQATASFNVFANDGVYIEPYLIAWVKDELGRKIYKHTVVKERIVPSVVSGQVAKVLGLGMERMRKRIPNEWISSEAIGKTGTTNECRTCWFAGSTPDLTTAVYIGCDDNSSLGDQVYALSTAFPIWLALHKKCPAKHKQFVYDARLKEKTINGYTGAVDARDDAYTILVPG